MNPDGWLQRFLFIRTRDTKPDGRPLYAYKCRDKEYEELKSIIPAVFDIIKGKWPPSLAAFFCAFAAETWRRCHFGGPWKWETVFAEIGHPVPEHGWIGSTIEKGLTWWKRPLLRNQEGHRELLVTIACEGGLPLHLLKNENAHLYRYFRQLLAAYHRERRFSSDANLLARRLAPILPRSLHHEIVFSLSSELIQKVVALQEQVLDALDPIAALNLQATDWRNSLPLPVEDYTIERLLRNLVNEARELSITERQKICWRRFLVQKDDEWTVEQLLELPSRVSGASLQRWSNKETVPPRMRFFLHSSRGIEQIALLTRLKGEAANAVYRCEVSRRQGVRLSSSEIINGVRLCLSDGTADYDLPVPGNQEWGPLPWAFRTNDDQMDFLGEGTVRCRENKMYVLAPPDGEFEGEGTFEPIGLSLSTDRILFEVIGKGEWNHPELGTCRYQCASANENTETLLLEGPRLAAQGEEIPPFRGMPNLSSINNDGGRRRVDNTYLEWRPVGVARSGWRHDAEECIGDVWIRYLDTTGAQLLLRKVRVIPSSFHMQVSKIGVDQQEAGTIRLTGLGSCRVRCDTLADCRFEVREFWDGVEIDSFAIPGVPTTQFACTLSWSEGRSMTLRLPFPRKGAAFVRGGWTIPLGGKVAVSRLTGVHAIIQAPPGSKFCSLNGRIKSCEAWSRNLAIHKTISLDDTGRGQFDLHRIQEKLSSMLALTAELDGVADLEILDGSGKNLTGIEAGLFELEFQPDYDHMLLSISPKSLGQLDQDWERRLNIRMIRLWKPEAEPISLERKGVITWIIPQELEPGPWLVLGEEGDWPRFRPVLWRIDGETEASESTLIQAILERDKLRRQVLLRELIEQLAEDPNHPDWSRFSEYLQLTRRYPACTFDLFQHLANKPKILVLALLKSDDEEFDAIWSLAYQLPFSWHLVSVHAWRKTASRYFSSLREALSGMDQSEELVWQTFQAIRERITIRQPFFRQLCDWLSTETFPDRKLESSEFNVAQRAPQVVWGWIEGEERKLQGRHDAEEKYPDGPQVMEWQHRADYPSQNPRYKHLARPYRPIRCAPFVAAHIALVGATYEQTLLFELQKLRYFDKEWFDAVFAFALCLGLAQLQGALLEVNA